MNNLNVFHLEICTLSCDDIGNGAMYTVTLTHGDEFTSVTAVASLNATLFADIPHSIAIVLQYLISIHTWSNKAFFPKAHDILKL